MKALCVGVVVLALLSLTVAQDEEYGYDEFDDDAYGGYDDDPYGDDSYGGYDDDMYGGYGDSAPPAEKLPGVVVLDEISLRKLRKTGSTILVEFVQESWSADSERLKASAEELAERDDIFVAKAILSESPSLTSEFSLSSEGGDMLLLLPNFEPAVVADQNGANAVAFIRALVDPQVLSIATSVKGLFQKEESERGAAFASIAEVVTSSSPAAQKVQQFLRVTWQRTGGAKEKVDAERSRLQNLLTANIDNISADKIVEFRVRLFFLNQMN